LHQYNLQRYSQLQQRPLYGSTASTSGKLKSPLASVHCALVNARSVVNKWNYFITELFFDSEPLIIAISESWLTADISNSLLNLAGYSSFRSDRVNKRGGGVLLLINDDLCPSLVNMDVDTSVHGDYFNVVACDLLCYYCVVKRIRLFAVYIVPNIPLSELAHLLHVLSSFIDAFKGTSILCGYFNMPLFDWSSNVSCNKDAKHTLFNEFCISHGLCQFVHENTRLSNILDIVLSNDQSVVGKMYVWLSLW
jgi:hypothetical protein